MRPTFGCDIHDLVFSPIDATTFAQLRHYVEEALTMWEPRISVTEVSIDPDHWDGRLNVIINYQLVASKDARTLVYPFYIIGEG